ncbi:hypothetical protein ACJVC5_18180 [Peredibacter sp. HCB2-198]|uniref:hypothetical protein n=1 Tax=Peredibacter sp. HCB2-198 TaxID=3383025 RepID=UPI0038B5BAD5
MGKKKVSILGLGWYGSPLRDELLRHGFDVVGSTRTKEKLSPDSRLLAYPELPSEDLMDADIVVLNIPPFPEELEWFKKWPWKKPWLIFISSTSESPTLLAQEEWVRANFTDWTILRFGGLLGGKRHPGKHLSGKKNLAAPKRPVNLLHLEDAVGVTVAVIQNNVKGKTLGVVCDEHRTREEFYSEYCRENNLPLPEFDQSDLSTGKIVPNEEIKKFYKFRNS